MIASNLRKQWHQELSKSSFCRAPSLSPDRMTGDQVGHFRPFDLKDTVVICSCQFARSKAGDVHATPWDLSSVIDEAHRLRNVYKPGNIIANTLKQALERETKAPTDCHASSELVARTVWTREFHRRAHIRRY